MVMKRMMTEIRTPIIFVFGCSYRALILGLTFVAYTCYHLSRKPISVVKGQLVNCSDDAERPPSVVGIHIATMLSAKTNETNCTSFISKYYSHE